MAQRWGHDCTSPVWPSVLIPPDLAPLRDGMRSESHSMDEKRPEAKRQRRERPVELGGSTWDSPSSGLQTKSGGSNLERRLKFHQLWRYGNHGKLAWCHMLPECSRLATRHDRLPKLTFFRASTPGYAEVFRVVVIGPLLIF